MSIPISGSELNPDAKLYVARTAHFTASRCFPEAIDARDIRGSSPRSGRPARMARQIVETLARRWSDIFVSSVGSVASHDCVGRSFQELAELRSREPVDVMLDLLRDVRGDVNMLSFNQSEENLRLNLPGETLARPGRGCAQGDWRACGSVRDEGRGFLLPGMVADITVLDPAVVACPASYAEPEQPPVGIRSVFRAGRRASSSIT